MSARLQTSSSELQGEEFEPAPSPLLFEITKWHLPVSILPKNNSLQADSKVDRRVCLNTSVSLFF